MKKMLMTMLCLLMALGMGAKNDDVQLKVIVTGYEGGYVMLAHGHDYDTLRADEKGRFDLRRHMERPAQLMLVVDQLRSGGGSPLTGRSRVSPMAHGIWRD